MKKILLIMVAMFAFGWQNVRAQDAIKIVTNHPDFKIKVKRCAASGKTVVLDLILTNEGVSDVEGLEVVGGGAFGGISEAYDDEGNIYPDVHVKVANNREYTNLSQGLNIPTGVPMKVSVRLDGVANSAESIARLKLIIVCHAWGIGYEKPVRISNIPISRN